MNNFPGILASSCLGWCNKSLVRRFFLRFRYGFKKMLRLNQLSDVTVERIPDTKEAEVPTISTIPDKTVDLDK